MTKTGLITTAFSLLLSASAFSAEALVGGIYGCRGEVTVKNKDKIVSQIKAVVFRPSTDYSAIRYFNVYDLGKIYVLTGVKKAGTQGLDGARFQYDTDEDIESINDLYPIETPIETVAMARQSHRGVYIVKEADNSYSAQQLGSGENLIDMPKCSTDPKQVSEWVKEVEKMSPF